MIDEEATKRNVERLKQEIYALRARMVEDKKAIKKKRVELAGLRKMLRDIEAYREGFYKK